MILHSFPYSSASYRVRIALNLKGLAYETRNYVLRAGEHRDPNYLALNPAGLVPLLEVDGVRLGQSLAIIDYLDTTRPEPMLVPAEPLARAKALEMAYTIACDIHPIGNLRVLKYLEREMGQDQAALDAWIRHWVELGFATLEPLLPDAPYAGGDAPGLVDLCVVPQLFNARRYKVDLTPYPKLVGMGNRAAALAGLMAA